MSCCTTDRRFMLYYKITVMLYNRQKITVMLYNRR